MAVQAPSFSSGLLPSRSHGIVLLSFHFPGTACCPPCSRSRKRVTYFWLPKSGLLPQFSNSARTLAGIFRSSLALVSSCRYVLIKWDAITFSTAFTSVVAQLYRAGIQYSSRTPDMQREEEDIRLPEAAPEVLAESVDRDQIDFSEGNRAIAQIRQIHGKGVCQMVGTDPALAWSVKGQTWPPAARVNRTV